MSQEAWSEMHSRTGPRPEPRVTLTIDGTTAHLLVEPALTNRLLLWFRGNAIYCRLRPEHGVGGCDLIDFGDPFPTEEKRIRELLAQWLTENR